MNSPGDPKERVSGEATVDIDEGDEPLSPPTRANPRLIEYARRVRPMPRASAKNALLLLLFLAGLSGIVMGVRLRIMALLLSSLLFLFGWCCCPWCALEREVRSGESAPLMLGNAGGDDELQGLNSESGP